MSHTLSILFGGTATLTSIMCLAQSKAADSSALGTGTAAYHDAATALVVKAASTSATEQAIVLVRGVVRVNAGGTFEPDFQYSAAPGGVPTIKANSCFRLEYLGPATATEIGAWA